MSASGDPIELVRRLKALNDLVRLRILRLLDRNELSVGELSRALQIPQSTVSRHLKMLLDGEWIIVRSVGTASLYHLVADALVAETDEFWQLIKGQLGTSVELREDDARLAEVLAERSTDSKEFFGRIGGEWEQLRAELFGEAFTIDALLALISPDWVVGDLGCGTGDASCLMAPIVQRVIAVDREPAMLEAARKRLADFDNVDFRQGDLLSLPIKDRKLDAALVMLVMHHIPDPQDAVAEIARTLRQHGVIMIVDMVAHNREAYRHTMGHQHLGFAEEVVTAWAEAAGLARVNYRRLRPSTEAGGPGLFVATMRKP